MKNAMEKKKAKPEAHKLIPHWQNMFAIQNNYEKILKAFVK